MSKKHLSVTVGLLLACSSCSRRGGEARNGEGVATPVAAKATPAAEPATESRVDYMQEHFKQALTMKDALVAGDLEATRKSATWIAEHKAPADSPDAWIPHITELRQVMAGAESAADLATVAEALARASIVCGRCHQAAGVTPRLAKSPEPMADDNDMLVHAWASDRMWEGLVIPDAKRWSQGVAAMKDWPLEAFAQHPRGSELAPMAVALRKLAADGFSATADGDRAQILGKMLAVCASCHRESRP